MTEIGSNFFNTNNNQNVNFGSKRYDASVLANGESEAVQRALLADAVVEDRLQLSTGNNNKSYSYRDNQLHSSVNYQGSSENKSFIKEALIGAGLIGGLIVAFKTRKNIKGAFSSVKNFFTKGDKTTKLKNLASQNKDKAKNILNTGKDKAKNILNTDNKNKVVNWFKNQKAKIADIFNKKDAATTT